MGLCDQRLLEQHCSNVFTTCIQCLCKDKASGLFIIMQYIDWIISLSMFIWLQWLSGSCWSPLSTQLVYTVHLFKRLKSVNGLNTADKVKWRHKHKPPSIFHHLTCFTLVLCGTKQKKQWKCSPLCFITEKRAGGDCLLSMRIKWCSLFKITQLHRNLFKAIKTTNKSTVFLIADGRCGGLWVRNEERSDKSISVVQALRSTFPKASKSLSV